MLTRKQHELLIFIDKHLRRTGFCPSFEEMKEALNLKSKSGIHRLISALEERGFLQRRPHRARALEVIRLPDMPAEPPARAPGAHGVELPLYGRIAAGSPIEALQEGEGRIAVPDLLVGQGDHYVLEIRGDSMVDAGILDGDMVVIRKGDQAENGETVVALIDEAEATLKRLYRRGDSIELEPANARYETRVLPAARVRVQGRMVALMRRC